MSIRGAVVQLLSWRDDMHHVIGPNKEAGSGRYVGPLCPLFYPAININVVHDVYVSVIDGIPIDLCILQRETAKTGRGGWALQEGDQVNLNGRYYHESFSFVNLENENSGGETFREFLVDLEFTATGSGFVCYQVGKNISPKIRFKIMYLYNIERLPMEIRKDTDAIKMHLREQFAKRVNIS